MIKEFIKYQIGRIAPKTLAKRIYRKQTGRALNLSNPQDFNEKMQYLSLCTDTSLWTRLADKYAVKEYIAEKGLELLAVPTLGIWDSADKIDFEALPRPYVLKSTCGWEDIVFIEEGKEYDFDKIREHLRRSIAKPFGYMSAELHYTRIPRRIIAEPMLDAGSQDFKSTTLIDYKVFCLNGTPECVLVFYNRRRNPEIVDISLKATDWSDLGRHLTSNETFHIGNPDLPRPVLLDRMLSAARSLAEGIPEVRVDFYIIGGKLYVGEMTFTSAAGHIPYFSREYLLELGRKLKI